MYFENTIYLYIFTIQLGVPKTTFPFPFAMLRGVRLAVPYADAEVVGKTSQHLRDVLKQSHND